jgi:hypothetical protein
MLIMNIFQNDQNEELIKVILIKTNASQSCPKLTYQKNVFFLKINSSAPSERPSGQFMIRI